MKALVRRVVRPGLPAVLLAALAWPRLHRLLRLGAFAALVGGWTATYAKYRKISSEQTAAERELLQRVNWEAYTRHYNELDPTIEEEFDLWGEYHQHRHEMRYDLVGAAVREHLPANGMVLDVGCGSGLVADRLLDVDATYVGVDFGGPHVEYASKRFADADPDRRLQVRIGRCAAEGLPFADDTFDVLVMSEVIEHLMRPELAVWEIARVLKPGGVFVMTTNNASEVPLRSPLSHWPAWFEKAWGATHPKVISLRPWIWPYPVPPEILPPGSPPVHLPHTHHIFGETQEMFAKAGLATVRWSTFEFPPPQSATARWLEGHGERGRRVVDLIERVATALPGINRLGCHVFVISRKVGPPVASSPPAGTWPGPFSL